MLMKSFWHHIPPPAFQLDDLVHKLMPRLPIALQEATSRMASRDATARPTAQLLQLIKYFMWVAKLNKFQLRWQSNRKRYKLCANLPSCVESCFCLSCFPFAFCLCLKWNWHLLGAHIHTHTHTHLLNPSDTQSLSQFVPVAEIQLKVSFFFFFIPVNHSSCVLPPFLHQHTHTLITSVCQMRAVIRPERHTQCKANGSWALGKIVCKIVNKK